METTTHQGKLYEDGVALIEFQARLHLAAMSSSHNDERDDRIWDRDRQLDLIELIGDSWLPQPRSTTMPPRACPAPVTQRLKSSNPIAHLTAGYERRRHHNSEPPPCDTGSMLSGSVSIDAAMTGGSDSEIVDELGVGSVVEVATDTHHRYYGVVRWLGRAEDMLYCGVELEEEVPELGDGSHGGIRLFTCAPGRALFVPAALCRRDSRFVESDREQQRPPPDRVPTPPSTHAFGGGECDPIEGVIAPLSGLDENACGKNRGIQGHHNSCYLDATLFAMFTFTGVFDSLLYRPPELADGPQYAEVQRVLRDEIVNPLRRRLFVRADRVMKLRRLLDRLSDIEGLTSEEKDPEEFLNSLVAQTLRAEPFLKLSSGQEAYYYQLFVEKDHALELPSVQQLLEQSLQTSGVKLREAPAVLIVQMPRFGKQYKMYPRILPSPLLDVTDLIEDVPRQCTVCGALARWECGACLGDCDVGLESTAFCGTCLAATHANAARAGHRAAPLRVPRELSGEYESCPVPRIYMELFAVLCIETSHYVAFVKAGEGHDAPWCFFDSMADRKGERDGYNIPEVAVLPELGTWLGEDCARAERRLPPHAKRLLCDAYMCLYRSPDVAMYR